MPRDFLEVSLEPNKRKARELLGTGIPDYWYEAKRFIALRLNDYKNNPDYIPWGPRAIILKSQNTMIGMIGFHTPPNPEYLTSYVPSGIEIGYEIFPTYQKQGYVSEALQGLIQSARQNHGIRNLVLSISPENQASLAVARKFGFVKVAEHMDDEDGLEYVFVMRLSEFPSKQHFSH